MAIIFWSSSPKIWKSGIFGSNFKNFSFLLQILQYGKFEGADFNNDNGFSKLLPKTPKKDIFDSKFNSNFYTKLCI